MHEIQLIFGPDDTYFFWDGKIFKWRASQSFADWFNGAGVMSVEAIGLGIGDSFFVNYTNNQGRNLLYFKHNDHYAALKSWIYDEGLSHANLEINLGPDDSFFATSSQGNRWRGISEDACDYYQKFTSPSAFLTRRVKSMDIGPNGTFLGIGIDNTWFWDLKDQFPALTALDPVKHLPNARFVSISPFAANRHFCVFEDGTAHWSLPTAWAKDMQAIFQQYAQAMANVSVGQTYSPAPRVQYQQQQQQQQQQYSPRPAQPARPSFWNRRKSSAQSGYDHAQNTMGLYNNYQQVQQQVGSGGGGDNFGQAMDVAQNSVDAINNVTNLGLQLTNAVTGNSMMIGQLGQMGMTALNAGGAVAACSIM